LVAQKKNIERAAGVQDSCRQEMRGPHQGKRHMEMEMLGMNSLCFFHPFSVNGEEIFYPKLTCFLRCWKQS
jgi:hypothetical protein